MNTVLPHVMQATDLSTEARRGSGSRASSRKVTIKSCLEGTVLPHVMQAAAVRRSPCRSIHTLEYSTQSTLTIGSSLYGHWWRSDPFVLLHTPSYSSMLQGAPRAVLGGRLIETSAPWPFVDPSRCGTCQTCILIFETFSPGSSTMIFSLPMHIV